MKATRVEPVPAFRPIVITIETPEEANHLFALLNMSDASITHMYNNMTQCRKISDEAVTNMYRTLAQVYQP